MRRRTTPEIPGGIVVAMPVAIVVGIFGGEVLGAAPAGGALIGGVVALTVAFGSGRPVRRGAFLLLALVLVACAMERRALDGLEHSPLTGPVATRADAVLRGTLVGDPDGGRWTTRVLLRVDDVRILDRGRRSPRISVRRTVLVVGSDLAAGRLAVLASGDRVVLSGWLHPLDGFDERWRWHHAVAGFDAGDLLDATTAPSMFDAAANTAREIVLRGTDVLPATERALVAGFLVGDTRDLPDEVLTNFRDSGLSHLLAVSGANLAFVLALVGPGLRRLPRRGRLVVTVAVLVLFGAMTRWEPSVLRAGAMATVAVLAAHVGRPARGVRMLAVAVSGLLLVDPFLVHSVGFGLSVGATLGIATLAGPVARHLPGPAWAREALGTTLAAQVGVLPVLVPVFGSLPLVSVPANLLAVPLAAPLTIWGLVAGALAGAIATSAPGVARALQWPTLILADAVLGIARAAAAIPLAVSGEVLGVAALLVAPAIVGRHRRMLARRGTRPTSTPLPPG